MSSDRDNYGIIANRGNVSIGNAAFGPYAHAESTVDSVDFDSLARHLAELRHALVGVPLSPGEMAAVEQELEVIEDHATTTGRMTAAFQRLGKILGGTATTAENAAKIAAAVKKVATVIGLVAGA